MAKWLHFILLGTLFLTPALTLSWDGGTSEISTSNNNFAFDLYQVVVSDSDENVFFSPYSISQAGAMLYGGARADTASQMSDVFSYTLAPNELAQDYTEANTSLSNQGADLPPEMAEGKFQLNVVNGIWAQEGYGFSADYLDFLTKGFSALLEEADFVSDADGTRQDINQWVSDQTAEKLQDVIPEGALDTDTRMVLVNAIYLNALWQIPFWEGSTYSAPFTLLSGEQATIDMMQQNGVDHDYVQGADYQAVTLPYMGSSIEMIIIVPDNLVEFEATLNAEEFMALRQVMTSTYLNVEIPKFQFKSDIPLKDSLQTMGMVDAFDPNVADLTGMVDADVMDRLFVSNAIHSAFISVDEKGTEAAAVTVISVSVESMPANPPQLFRADRTFIFAIYDHETDLVLFLGRVTNPNQ